MHCLKLFEEEQLLQQKNENLGKGKGKVSYLHRI